MATAAPRTAWTYAASGVDVSVRARALAALLAPVKYRSPPDHGRVISAPGHYAGLVRIGRETIAITTDTVGTKVLLAERLGRWEEVGEDLVGVNVNDLAAMGARPAALVDTILCARPEEGVFRAIGRGLDRGLRAARCALLGGETAIVPDIVHGVDLSGTAIGFFPRGRRPTTGAKIRPGDRILGIPSNGVHANGFTLLRKLLDDSRIDPAAPRPGSRTPVGEELLRPTRIYTHTVDALADRTEVHGLAHMSGGGVRNLVRLHPRVAFVLDQWPEAPSLFSWIASLGNLSAEEMYQTFNMGIGFMLVVGREHLAETRRRLARAGAPDAVEIGHIERGTGVSLPPLGLRYVGYS
ncbi:MAG: phosphoribosylformylglycinamidine cyclo-ligase [Thermoplasmata archaeon]|jgi:phosphoribosylformylglycinamidine cyclo-ligase